MPATRTQTGKTQSMEHAHIYRVPRCGAKPEALIGYTFAGQLARAGPGNVLTASASRDAMGKASEDETGMLTAIKVLHTVVWALACWQLLWRCHFLLGDGAFRWAAILSVMILIEGSCAPCKWVAMPDD